MTQAALEGVVMALREAEDSFGGRFPDGPIPLVGEGSRSALWLLIAASVLNRPLLRLSNADIAAAFGAARLGRMAATGETAEQVCVQPPLIEIVDPVAELHEAYDARRADFRAFAQSLRTVAEPRAVAAGRRRRLRR
jgi:xylulokinase